MALTKQKAGEFANIFAGHVTQTILKLGNIN